MKRKWRGCLECIALFGFILLVTGCAPKEPEEATSSPPAPQPASQPTVTLPYASLTAKEIVVKRFRVVDPQDEPQENVLQKDDEIDIQEEDRISVQEAGRGLLRFQDNLLVEIFHDTELQIADATLEQEEFIFVRLQQIFGTTRAELNKEAGTRIRFETDYATIESVDALDSDTEFVICHAKALTCMVTLDGAVEVEAQGQVETVEAGEASYIFPGEPPSPAICASVNEVEKWIDQYRNAEEIPPLGALVAGWPQEPCTTLDQAAPTPTALPLASSDRMVNIAGDEYEVGDPNADEFHIPLKAIMIAGFWIDQYEVTNAQYQMFMDENSHPPPASWLGGILPAGQENHPVKGVTWDEASTYCAWVDKRLPSESEWEVAARGPGPEPALYPWGPDPGAGGQVFDLPRTDTYEVGTNPFNRSPFDVYDMAGNVWEWVGEPYSPVENEDGDYVLRGGRHGLLKDMAYRQPAASNSERFVPFAGFRCAADHVEGE